MKTRVVSVREDKKLLASLRGVLLLSVIVLSMFAFTRFIKPADATPDPYPWGTHKIQVYYYQTALKYDHDAGIAGAGEWYFVLLWYDGSHGSKPSGEYKVNKDRNGWKTVDHVDLTYNGALPSLKWFQVWAYEQDWPIKYGYTKDKRVFIPADWGYHAAYKPMVWHYDSYTTGDVRFHWKFRIHNYAPSVGSISGPDVGEPGVPYTFSTTGSDPDGDSITWEWSVRKWYWSIQPATGPSLTYTFPSAGDYTVRVRTKDYFGRYSGYSYKMVKIRPPAEPTITITRLRTNKRIYTVGENIVIKAWIKIDGSPLTEGTVYARVYAMGVSGKGDIALTYALHMTLVDPASGKWRTTYGPIPWPGDPDAFEGTYVVYVTAYRDPYGETATKSTTCFVAYRHTESSVAKFVNAISPSRVAVGNNFDVKARIKNPSGSSQTLRVRLILPAGMTKVSGALARTITLAPGAAKTLRWTLKSTTATDKRVKIRVLKAGTVRAKLVWNIRDP